MQHILIQAFKLLSQAHKQKIIPLILLLTLGSGLDFFSLASFVPAILIIINPQQIYLQSWLNDFYRITGFHDPVYGAVMFTVIAMLFIFIKTRLQIWITLRKANYAYNVAADIALRALTQYMNVTYLQFTKIDYARAVNRISNLPLTFANNIIIPFGTILSESIISLLLISCLVWYNYTLFLFLSTIILPVVFIYRVKRKKMGVISQQLKTAYPALLKNTWQVVEGLLEIRTLRKENYFKRKFNRPYDSLGKILSVDHANNASALRTTELVAALCVGLLILYVIITRQSSPDSILLLMLYAGASFRVIPSINRMFAAFLQIRTNEFAVEELTEALGNQIHHTESTDREPPFENVLEFQNISFGYPDSPLLLNNASLTILKGEKIIVTGKSGAGKTSLLLLLLRFVKEQRGEIYVDGFKLETEHTLGWQRKLGYVPQHPYMLDATLAENIAFGISEDQINLKLMNQLLADLDLLSWINNLPDGLQTAIGEKGIKISGGQRQRLAIARALYHGAEILLLDEITNQLDQNTRSEIMNVIHAGILKSKTIIMISHDVEKTNLFDAVYELRNGTFVPIFKKENVKAF